MNNEFSFIPSPSAINFPITILYKKYNLLFGIVKINYMVEDRHPDLEDGHPDKDFKNYINVSVFGRRRYNWTFRTKYFYEELPHE